MHSETARFLKLLAGLEETVRARAEAYPAFGEKTAGARPGRAGHARGQVRGALVPV